MIMMMKIIIICVQYDDHHDNDHHHLCTMQWSSWLRSSSFVYDAIIIICVPCIYFLRDLSKFVELHKCHKASCQAVRFRIFLNFPPFFLDYLPFPVLHFLKLCEFICRRGGWLVGCSFHDQLLENVDKFPGRAASPLPCCQLSRIKLNKPRNLHGIYKFHRRKFKWAFLFSSFVTNLTFPLDFWIGPKPNPYLTTADHFLSSVGHLLSFPILVASEWVGAHTEKSLLWWNLFHFFSILYNMS